MNLNNPIETNRIRARDQEMETSSAIRTNQANEGLAIKVGENQNMLIGSQRAESNLARISDTVKIYVSQS